jgi:hypothetical protein
MFSELLGIWKRRPYRYYDALSNARKGNLCRRRVRFLSVIGTTLAQVRLGKFFSDLEVAHTIVIGRVIPWLNEAGMEALIGRTLVDASGSLREPLQHLADPIFSPMSPLYRENQWERAKNLCDEIGFELLRSYAAERNWSIERQRGSALGFSGMQGRLVFSHNVPKTTLTLLWCGGQLEGKAWVPLFPARE